MKGIGGVIQMASGYTGRLGATSVLCIAMTEIVEVA